MKMVFSPKFTLQIIVVVMAIWVTFVSLKYYAMKPDKQFKVPVKVKPRTSGTSKSIVLTYDIPDEMRNVSESISIRAKGQPVRFRHYRTAQNANTHPNYTDGQMLYQFLNFKRVVQPKVAKSNVTFVFLHSGSFTSDVWVHTGTLKLLGALGYKVIAYDLPTYGFTQERLGHVTDFLFVSKVYYMKQLFEDMSNVILVAPSMSSKYALPFALTKPERLAGLVLVGPVGTGLVPRMKLESLQVPTLLISGDQDKKLGLESKLVLQIIPKFYQSVLKNAGHAAYIDQPEAFHSNLYNFARLIDSS